MTGFPEGVRIGQPGDEAALFAIFAMAHAENGRGTMHAPTVRSAIERACNGRDGYVIGYIPGPERIEGVLGLQPNRLWYNDPEAAKDHFWTELLFYVHPLHRRSRHWARLLRFAQWWADEIRLPVYVTLEPRDDLEAKEALLGRVAQRVASSYLFAPAAAAKVA